MQKLLLIATQDWAALQYALTAAGYEVKRTLPAEASLCEIFEAFRPDLLLLELGDDTLALQHVRRLLRAALNSHPIPLLALARRAHLNPPQLVVGVDDFLLPPYDSEEMLSRVQMALWRYNRVNSRHCVQIGGLAADLARRAITADGRSIALTLREYQLLVFLMTHHDRAFTREALLSQVWGYDFEGDVRVVDAYIKRVRNKLPAPYPLWIKTLRGVGYQFSHPETD